MIFMAEYRTALMPLCRQPKESSKVRRKPRNRETARKRHAMLFFLSNWVYFFCSYSEVFSPAICVVEENIAAVPVGSAAPAFYSALCSEADLVVVSEVAVVGLAVAAGSAEAVVGLAVAVQAAAGRKNYT